MADHAEDFAFVANSVERAVRTQRAACTEVLARREGRGVALARHLDRAYDAILRHVSARRSDFADALDDVVRTDAIVELRHLLWDVRKLQTNLRWLDAAKDPPLDLGTTYFVEAISRAIVARDVEVTVVADTSNVSYATTSDPYSLLIEDWGTGAPVDESTVVVVFVPRREQRSGLLHPLIVHELGHAADDAKGIVSSIWRQAQQRPLIQQKFAEAVAAEANARSADPKEVNSHLTERLSSWIAEAFCDAVAVQQLGPTYLYSFLAEVAAGNLDAPGPRHPSPRQRATHLLAQLERLSWTEHMNDEVPEIMTWIQALTSEPASHTGSDDFLRWAIDQLQVLIRRYAAGLLGDRVFRPDAEVLAEATALLTASIPPAQMSNGKAIAAEVVILSAWHAAVHECGGGPGGLALAPDATVLSELLPSTLELSALVGAWSL